MKTVKKVIVGILAALGAIFLLFIGIAMLSEFGIIKDSSDESQVRIEYKPQNIGEQIDEDAIPDSEYYSSLSEAMKNSNSETDPEQIYQKNIDEEIARFENENYVSIYLRSVKDQNTECLTFAKFKKIYIYNEYSDGDRKRNSDGRNTVESYF